MPRLAVTSTHFRLKNTFLRLKIDSRGQCYQRKWKIRHVSFIFDTIRDTHLIHDIVLAFTICGTRPSKLTVRGGTVEDAYKHLRATPIPDDARFVYLEPFGSAPGDIQIHLRDDCKTYGDLFDLWGAPSSEDGIAYSEYSNNALLSLTPFQLLTRVRSIIRYTSLPIPEKMRLYSFHFTSPKRSIVNRQLSPIGTELAVQT